MKSKKDYCLLLIKKKKTKKQLKEFYQLQRSIVGNGMNLGEREIEGKKKYSRNHEKTKMKKIINCITD